MKKYDTGSGKIKITTEILVSRARKRKKLIVKYCKSLKKYNKIAILFRYYLERLGITDEKEKILYQSDF